MKSPINLQAYKQRHGHDIDGVRPVMIPSDDGMWFSRSEVELAFRSNGMTDEDKRQIVEEYDAAMCASNEAGYAGITAADTIRYLIQRAEAAEEEIARRDAAAGEPVGLVEFSDYMTAEELAGMKPRRVAVKELFEGGLKVGDHLYTAAPPAVLPPERVSLNNGVIGFDECYNQCRADALVLGAQPQEPVVVSDDVLREVIRAWISAPYPGPCVYEKMRKALGAQPAAQPFCFIHADDLQMLATSGQCLAHAPGFIENGTNAVALYRGGDQ